MDSARIGAPRARGRRAGAGGRGSVALPLTLTFAWLLAWPDAAPAQDKPAQDKPAQDRPAAPPPGPPAGSEPIDPATVIRLLGREVKAGTGEVVAQIVNLLVDAKGEPRAAILDYGGFLGVGKRRIAVAWRALSFAPGTGGGTVTLGLDRDQLKSFPEYKPDGPLLMAAPSGEVPAPPNEMPAAPGEAPVPPGEAQAAPGEPPAAPAEAAPPEADAPPTPRE